MGVFDYRVRAGATGMVYNYNVPYSCRFDEGSSGGLLSRTQGTPTGNKAFTYSFWWKGKTDIGGITGNYDFDFLDCISADNDIISIGRNDPRLYFALRGNTGDGGLLQSTMKFRDPSSWYHCVVAVDTTQATAANRMRMYKNGVEITAFDTASYCTQNYVLENFNTNATSVRIGNQDGTYPGGCYMAETYFIDGQQLTPSSFGEINSDTNQWEAKGYTGTYGDNGFYLKFQDSSNLGDDSSGNGNDWTVSNLAADNQMIDGPKAADGIVGSTDASGNFCTMNSLMKADEAAPAYTKLYQGNLWLNNGGQGSAQSTFAMSAGKWYWECLLKTAPDWWPVTGFGKTTTNVGLNNQNYTGEQTGSWGYKSDGGQFYYQGSILATYTSAGIGDILQFAIDMDAGKAWVGINNTWVNSGVPASGTNAIVTSGLTDDITPIFSDSGGSGHRQIANFGQDSSFGGEKTAQGNVDSNKKGDFYYAPPTGFLALCSTNLTDPSIDLPSEYFNTALYTGSGSSQSITTGLQPDFCWVKNRLRASGYSIVDVVRGDGQVIDTDVTTAEVDQASAGAQSISSTSFTVDGTDDDWNRASDSYVSWNWKAGGAPTTDNVAGAGAVPTAGSVKINGSNSGSALAGSIAATRLSANTTSGMSIVQYTGTGSAATIAHGLGVKPALMIFKKTNAVDDWAVWQKDLHGDSTLNALKMTGASYVSSSTWWNSTDPTTSVINVGTNGATGAANEFICYVFAEIEGFSKVGNYVVIPGAPALGRGNFIYTGFKPAFFLNKMSDGPDGAGSWFLYDNKRVVYNLNGNYLVPDWNYVENNDVVGGWDFLSNGIKLRAEFSANTTIFIAFAESPFKFSNAR